NEVRRMVSSSASLVRSAWNIVAMRPPLRLWTPCGARVLGARPGLFAVCDRDERVWRGFVEVLLVDLDQSPSGRLLLIGREGRAAGAGERGSCGVGGVAVDLAGWLPHGQRAVRLGLGAVVGVDQAGCAVADRGWPA